MEQRKPSEGEAQQVTGIEQHRQHVTPVITAARRPPYGRTGLDAQLAELIETVWECERIWTLDDHVDAAIRYGR
jgi:hypothetical protein